MNNPLPPVRYRITYSKTGALKYTGHLDLHRIWERSLRRARLPLAYSQGFHPQPRIQQACALPLGFTSRCEILDIWLETSCGASDIEAALANTLPPGLIIQTIKVVDLTLPALQTRVRSARYKIELLEPLEENKILDAISNTLSSITLQREWKKKNYDLRPLIQDLSYESGNLEMLLSAREGATGRPEEVLAVLDIPTNITRIERVALVLEE